MIMPRLSFLGSMIFCVAANAQVEGVENGERRATVRAHFHEVSFSLPNGWRPLEPDLNEFVFTNATVGERQKGTIIPKGRCLLGGVISKSEDSMEAWLTEQLQKSVSERGDLPPAVHQEVLLASMHNLRAYAFYQTWSHEPLQSKHWLFEFAQVRYHISLLSYVGYETGCESASKSIIRAYLEAAQRVPRSRYR